MEELTLAKIVEKGILGVEESPVAYYIWPRTGSKYVSYVYRMDKATRKITTEFIIRAVDDYPDFLERTNEVPIETLLAG